MDWKSLEQTLAAACEGEPDEETAEHAVRAAELVAATPASRPTTSSHDRLNDLRYRLGDVAAA